MPHAKHLAIMKPLTIVTSYTPGPSFEKTLRPLVRSDLVEHAVIVSQEPASFEEDKCQILISGPVPSDETLHAILNRMRTEYFLLILGSRQISIDLKALERILEKAGASEAGLVYADFYEENDHWKTLHPLNDYQTGSVRDDFDFGAMVLFSVTAIRKALEKYGPIPHVNYAGLYDLRLKVSIEHNVYHLQEPLYSVIGAEENSDNGKMFAYVDPRHEAAQKEMEAVFTDYLKRIGAYLSPRSLREVEPKRESFPVEASVVIPVRNRKETIAEAVESALSQQTDFLFNVIVVNNHSTDGTTAVLSGLAERYASLKHMVPQRTDLGIGGCWNEALHADVCGRYAVQLDSDDLYSGSHTLQRLVDTLRQGGHAMVIGAYTLVDSRLEVVPPGLIDHREWTDENGHNNALRINGLGAPRAFATGVIRKIGFPNVSYGEDYAVALRLCREYRIGRIYESLYLCRRWPGNSDAALSVEEMNRNDAFKDKIRTIEILARKKIAEHMAHRE